MTLKKYVGKRTGDARELSLSFLCNRKYRINFKDEISQGGLNVISQILMRLVYFEKYTMLVDSIKYNMEF